MPAIYYVGMFRLFRLFTFIFFSSFFFFSVVFYSFISLFLCVGILFLLVRCVQWQWWFFRKLSKVDFISVWLFVAFGRIKRRREKKKYDNNFVRMKNISMLTGKFYQVNWSRSKRISINEIFFSQQCNNYIQNLWCKRIKSKTSISSSFFFWCFFL